MPNYSCTWDNITDKFILKYVFGDALGNEFFLDPRLTYMSTTTTAAPSGNETLRELSSGEMNSLDSASPGSDAINIVGRPTTTLAHSSGSSVSVGESSSLRFQSGGSSSSSASVEDHGLHFADNFQKGSPNYSSRKTEKHNYPSLEQAHSDISLGYADLTTEPAAFSDFRSSTRLLRRWRKKRRRRRKKKQDRLECPTDEVSVDSVASHMRVRTSLPSSISFTSVGGESGTTSSRFPKMISRLLERLPNYNNQRQTGGPRGQLEELPVVDFFPDDHDHDHLGVEKMIEPQEAGVKVWDHLEGDDEISRRKDAESAGPPGAESPIELQKKTERRGRLFQFFKNPKRQQRLRGAVGGAWSSSSASKTRKGGPGLLLEEGPALAAGARNHDVQLALSAGRPRPQVVAAEIVEGAPGSSSHPGGREVEERAPSLFSSRGTSISMSGSSERSAATAPQEHPQDEKIGFPGGNVEGVGDNRRSGLTAYTDLLQWGEREWGPGDEGDSASQARVGARLVEQGPGALVNNVVTSRTNGEGTKTQRTLYDQEATATDPRADQRRVLSGKKKNSKHGKKQVAFFRASSESSSVPEGWELNEVALHSRGYLFGGNRNIIEADALTTRRAAISPDISSTSTTARSSVFAKAKNKPTKRATTTWSSKEDDTTANRYFPKDEVVTHPEEVDLSSPLSLLKGVSLGRQEEVVQNMLRHSQKSASSWWNNINDNYYDTRNSIHLERQLNLMFPGMHQAGAGGNQSNGTTMSGGRPVPPTTEPPTTVWPGPSYDTINSHPLYNKTTIFYKLSKLLHDAANANFREIMVGGKSFPIREFQCYGPGGFMPPTTTTSTSTAGDDAEASRLRALQLLLGEHRTSPPTHHHLSIVDMLREEQNEKRAQVAEVLGAQRGTIRKTTSAAQEVLLEAVQRDETFYYAGSSSDNTITTSVLPESAHLSTSTTLAPKIEDSDKYNMLTSNNATVSGLDMEFFSPAKRGRGLLQQTNDTNATSTAGPTTSTEAPATAPPPDHYCLQEICVEIEDLNAQAVVAGSAEECAKLTCQQCATWTNITCVVCEAQTLDESEFFCMHSEQVCRDMLFARPFTTAVVPNAICPDAPLTIVAGDQQMTTTSFPDVNTTAPLPRQDPWDPDLFDYIPFGWFVVICVFPAGLFIV